MTEMNEMWVWVVNEKEEWMRLTIGRISGLQSAV